MKVTKLQLSQFRGFDGRVIAFTAPTTIIVGPNAKGKTSIIEALHLISHGSSFRAGKVDEMIRFGQDVGRVGVAVEYPDQIGDPQVLEMTLTNGLVQGKKTRKQLYRINSANKRKKDFVAKLASVSFRPEDLRLVEGSPSRRRAFLNDLLSLTDRQYAVALRTYEQTLKRRNKVLWAVKEKLMPATTLNYWDQQLVKNGDYLQAARIKFFQSCTMVDFPLQFSVEYIPSVISEKRIQEYKAKAIAAGHTLIGPHKDDFEVYLEGWRDNPQKMSIMKYGSRGQQRLAVLWLKICELDFVDLSLNQKALLLLDDVMSELDETSQELIWKLTNGRQTIITTADDAMLKNGENNLEILKIE